MRYLILFAISISFAFSADFTTYIGDQFAYSVSAIATDATGNTYATGTRTIPIPGLTTPLGDVFVTKLDATGRIVFTTTFGGKGTDQGNAIALDPAGDIWIGGSTSSDNFPLTAALLDSSDGGGFLVKLAPDGTVIYSSYFYGAVNGVATDSAGNVYLTGTTTASDFPTTEGLPAGMVSAELGFITSGAFVTKLDPMGSKIIYSALIAGSQSGCGASCPPGFLTTTGVAIAVDPAGEAFLSGNTNTTDLPVTSGGRAGYGAFAAKINAAGNQLAYLTYLSVGTNLDQLPLTESTTATAIMADTNGNAYLTGSTDDPAFPATAGAFQTKLNSTAARGLTNAFAMKLKPAGGVDWATYLGGPGSDQANAIGVDNSGNVWLTGTNAAGFPSALEGPGYITAAGDFVAELSADGSKLLDSMELATAGQALALDPTGLLHVASQTGLVSTITPGQPPTPRIIGIMNAAQGPISGRIAPGEIISIFGFGLGPTTPATAAPASGAFPTSLEGVQVLVDGSPIPLLYVSESQINAEIPSPLTGAEDGNAIVQVINGSATLPDFRTSVDPSIFGIFTNQDGTIAAINQDGTLNSAANPAKAGTFVSIWATGLPSHATEDGAIATGANNWCAGYPITFGGVSEPITYCGAAPGLIDGVMQINFLIPSSVSLTMPTPAPVNFDFLGPQGQFWVE